MAARKMAFSRRSFLFASATALSACAGGAAGVPLGAPPSRPPAPSPELAAIERRIGGRLGVFAVDTATGHELSHRAEERFALCSTFKWILAAAVLEREGRGELSLGERVSFAETDLLEYAPVAREHVGEGAMTVEALAEACVTVSDNTAANLLLARLGGPTAITAFAREHGDLVTRLDRVEPLLNLNSPGDPRDTTSPRAMVGLMRRVLCGDALPPPGRERLLAWLRGCKTGQRRLAAGFPPDWRVGDKTGTGERGAVHDVAIAVPPGRPAVLVAVYTSDCTAPLADVESAHAEIARLVARPS